MKFVAANDDCTMVQPESAEEAGLLYWMAGRFGHRPITLKFDTTQKGGCDHYPTLWLTEVAPKKRDSDTKHTRRCSWRTPGGWDCSSDCLLRDLTSQEGQPK